MAEHRHDFRPASVKDAHGQPIAGARRCACGMEVTAGPLGINVNLVRAGQHFNDALASAMAELTRAMNRGKR